MTHFGIISPPVSGHIHPMSALGRELQSRGHQVTYFQLPDLEQTIRAQGLDFHPIGQRDFPAGSLSGWLHELGRRQGLSAVRFTVNAVAHTSAMLCRDAPDAIRATGVEALLVDQMEPAGGAVAERSGVPFVTVCCALSVNRDASVPPPFSPWPYRDQAWARLRNRVGYTVSDWLTRPIMSVVSSYRHEWNLPPLRSADSSFSGRAQISQMPREFDYPRAAPLPHFHYVGPLRQGTSGVEFPWDRLDGRPVVYASLGTLQNRRANLFGRIAEACRSLDVQLVISHGGGLGQEDIARLSDEAVVVPYAPQRELLARARLTITHAGLNTVLDSLTCGVPVVAIPITFEQPAIAERVHWTGVGRWVSLRSAAGPRLGEAIRRVLSQPRYTEAARRLAVAIAGSGGVRRAADLASAAV